MAILIDTSIFIGAERRGLPPELARSLIVREEAMLSCITASGLLFGGP